MKHRKTKHIIWKSLGFSIRVKGWFSLLIQILGLPMAFLPLMLSRQLQKLTDQIFLLPGGERSLLIDTAVDFFCLVFLFLMQLLYGFLQDYTFVTDKYRTKIAIQEYIAEQIGSVHYSYLENRDDFLKKIQLAKGYPSEEAASGIQKIFTAVRMAITFFSISLALWAVHPAIVFVLLITSIPAAVLSWLQSDETFRSRSKWSEEGSMAIHMFHVCSSNEAGIQEVRHYELFDYLKARWRAVADNYILQKNKLVAKHVRFNLLADFLRSGVYLLVLYVTVRAIYENPALGLGTFTLVFTLSGQLQQVTGNMFIECVQFLNGISYMDELFALGELERDETEEAEMAEEPERNAGDIVFRHVSFSYPGTETEVLHDVSLTIRAGERIAVVGDNGSGKSTCISLMTGIFSPDSGQVFIGGMDMEAHKQKLRRRISVIYQDFAHYEASLRDNITISDHEANRSEAEILELAEQINVSDVIKEQAEGLEAMLGHLSEKGADLSGGQWQKVALLRAVYRENADILILDEPTAALDPIAETNLYQDFSEISREKTTLFVSHRLGITALVDRILVFRDGRIIEDGSHRELMEKKGHYFEMYQAQAKWYQ